MKIFSVIILIAIIFIFALTAPIFNIKNIQIQGNDKTNAETIISLSGLKKEKIYLNLIVLLFKI